MVGVIPFFALSCLGFSAQSDAQPAFEAASVRRTPPGKLGYTSWGPYGTNRYTVSNATLDFLVQLGYGITHDQISGIEKLGSEHYEVTAKAEDGVILTYEQLKPRLQHLLEDRFKLAVHREQKEFDGYALVVAKSGAKLKPSAGVAENGVIYPGGLRLMSRSMTDFAAMLRSPAGRPVVDKTGIEGTYDFELQYAQEGDTASPLPSFFTALQEVYGLKLEKSKVLLETLVIDRVEKTPTEN